MTLLTLLTIVIPLFWAISLFLQAKTFRNLYRSIDQMNASLVRLEVLMLKGDLDTALQNLPGHCVSCGCVLMGGATQHKSNCEIRKIIDKNFPPVH